MTLYMIDDVAEWLQLDVYRLLKLSVKHGIMPLFKDHNYHYNSDEIKVLAFS